MTNSQTLAALIARVTAKVEYRMCELSESYAQAKAKVAEGSVAGPAVWAAVDALYA